MVKRKIIWSHRALKDLTDILDFFYKRNGNKTYSRKLNSKIRKSIRLLIKHPELGISTDIQNVRNLIIGDYMIFYEINDTTILINTIWDTRQNPDNLLKK